MNNYYGNNPYITATFVSSFEDQMKKQERVAIIAMLEIKRGNIVDLKDNLDTKLNDQQAELKDFATKTLVSNFKEGLVGSAADAAERQLTTDEVFKPDFENPIKG